jgi:DNA recombination protein RmuC
MGGGNSVSAIQLLISFSSLPARAYSGAVGALLAAERESVRRTEQTAGAAKEWLEHILREELSLSRAEAARSSSDLRGEVSASVERMGVSLREEVAGRLREIREDNDRRLEEMRRTVDDKLHDTLERRLGESFRQVSERLEQVHQGLGEMHALAAGVGDLKRVLTNVKTRGTWGEVQLGCLWSR